MKFVVRPHGKPAPAPLPLPFVLLSQSDWDDYGYKTVFDVTLYIQNTKKELGVIKIMREDQEGGFTSMPPSPFTELGNKYCSFGGKIEYYEAMFLLGPQVYDEYFKAIGDIVYDEVRRARFEHLEGYKVSLLRFSDAESTIRDASLMFAQPEQPVRDTTYSDGFKINFRTTAADGALPFVTSFDFTRNESLPHRTNVVIGYNGTGKTVLMSNLAIAASKYGYDNKEDALRKSAGDFVGTPPPIRTVIVISYSAFDRFVIPRPREIDDLRSRSDNAVLGYTYCGLRERVDEGNTDSTEYRLRTPHEIDQDFAYSVARVTNAGRTEILGSLLRTLFMDASFQRIGVGNLYSSFGRDEVVSLFQLLSSGHKIVLKMLVDLVAYLDDSHLTLVLIDEPETHLHPPLLAALLKCVRQCLDHFNGYAIIATHSPVVLQETPSKYVHVLRRMGDRNTVEQPTIETFGENIGVITQDVFNLDDGSTDWHGTLSELSSSMSLEEIEQLFGDQLGFGARSFIMSLQVEGSN